MVTKDDVVILLEKIGFLLDLKGENSFKIRAYHNAAQAIAALDEDIQTLVKKSKLQEIKGIGEALNKKITEFVTTGALKYYDDLKKSLPPGLLDMLKIQGLGPRRIKAIYDKLNISSIETLEKACLNNKIAHLEGFGPKTQENILRGILFLKKSSDFNLYDVASLEAQEIVAKLKKLKDVKQIEIAGSLRRHKELIRDIDILVSASSSENIMDTFTSLPKVAKVNAKGSTKSAITLKTGINTDLRVIKEKEFPYGLQHFTGSKEHNVALRSRAKKMGYKMNEYGLFKGNKNIPCQTEAEIYKQLKLQYIPPELRENTGEIEAAEKNKLPVLVEKKDLKGVFHVHSNYSDGIHSVEDMAKECQKLGFKYMVIADHSQSAHYANGLKPAAVKKQHQEIDKLNKKFKNFKIYKGTECDILPNGNLDYPDEILKTFDYVIGAIHSKFKMTEKEMTERIIKAMQNKYFSILSHPTGRLLLNREPYPINMEEIIKTAAKYNKGIELNCNPHRFDLDWRWCKVAKEHGVKIALCPDAHQKESISNIFYGLGIARKGWLEKKDILNAKLLLKSNLFR